jgi:hypothetical protein
MMAVVADGLVVVLWVPTAFGAIHTIAEFVAMIIFSDRDWDTPPGTGYITVGIITICSILTVIMTLRAPQKMCGRQAAPGSSFRLAHPRLGAGIRS